MKESRIKDRVKRKHALLDLPTLRQFCVIDVMMFVNYSTEPS